MLSSKRLIAQFPASQVSLSGCHCFARRNLPGCNTSPLSPGSQSLSSLRANFSLTRTQQTSSNKPNCMFVANVFCCKISCPDEKNFHQPCRNHKSRLGTKNCCFDKHFKSRHCMHGHANRFRQICGKETLIFVCDSLLQRKDKGKRSPEGSPSDTRLQINLKRKTQRANIVIKH